MVIQRLQSLFLLLAAIFMCVLCFVTPIANFANGEQLLVMNLPTLLIINFLAMALLIIDIFLFKNLRQQMRIALMCMVLIAASWGLVVYVAVNQIPEDAKITWWGFSLEYACALILTIFAHSRMKADYKLLRSYDRLR